MVWLLRVANGRFVQNTSGRCFANDDDGGDVDEAAMKADDYAWLTREEVVDRIEEERGKHQAKFFHYML